MKAVFLSCMLAASSLVVGCGDDDQVLRRGYGPGEGPPAPGAPPPGPGGSDPAPPPAPKCAPDMRGKEYAGFDAQKLAADRIDEAIGVDRGRVKPYSALVGEYPRVLGSTPSSLQTAGGTLGESPARWYAEPKASAIGISVYFRVAFDGCLQYVGGVPALATTPTAASATVQCEAMQRKFWSRAPSPDDVNACATVAMVDTASEPAPQRRWAYACASVLSAAEFVTY